LRSGTKATKKHNAHELTSWSSENQLVVS